MSKTRQLLVLLLASTCVIGNGAALAQGSKGTVAPEKAPAKPAAGGDAKPNESKAKGEKAKGDNPKGVKGKDEKDGDLMEALWNAQPSAEVMKAQAAAIAAQQGLSVNANLVDKAVNAYQKGDYEGALKMLTDDLREHPNSGTTHYYISRALKKMGKSDKAIEEMEAAMRLCPPETISSIAKYVLKEGDGDPFQQPTINFTVPQWVQDASNGVSSLWGAKPSKPATFTWTAPDMSGPFKEMYKNGSKWVKDIKKQIKGNKGGGNHGGGGGGYQSWAAETISMGQIHEYIDQSHANPKLAKWTSHPEGVSIFRQAPENIPEWDYWIARFKRSFQSLLLSNLARDATTQNGGTAKIVFSVDKNGNLRGSIYSSDADEVLNQCVVKSIKRLDRSRILIFPKESHISGWNFTMEWNFRILLNHIRRLKYAEEQRLQEEKRLQLEVEARLKKEKEDAALKAQQKKLEEEKKKLLEVQAKLKRLQELQFKANVSGMIIPKVGVKAKQLTLSDMAKMPINNDEDPFGNVDDAEIMSMPDMNK